MPEAMTHFSDNKELVVRFYNAIARGDIATLRLLGRSDYIQHDPDIETGIDGLVKHVAARTARTEGLQPIAAVDFVRVLVDGDFVMTLRRILPDPTRNLPKDKETALVDIFRVQDGKVAEHWDYRERFPRSSEPPKNENGRF